MEHLQCETCEGQGVIPIGEHEIIISEQMARDAGFDMEYVGSSWGTETEYGPCPNCEGSGIAPPPADGEGEGE